VELLPVAKKIAQAVGAKDYNILQNNGRIAHQEVDHVGCPALGFRVKGSSKAKAED
jgi:hypothetical protein